MKLSALFNLFKSKPKPITERKRVDLTTLADFVEVLYLFATQSDYFMVWSKEYHYTMKTEYPISYRDMSDAIEYVLSDEIAHKIFQLSREDQNESWEYDTKKVIRMFSRKDKIDALLK